MSIKSEYLKLLSTPIRWEVWSEKVLGFVNSAGVFEISIDDDLNFQTKTFYPGRDVDDLNVFINDQDLEFIKMVCEERYRIWVKEDFQKVNSKEKL